MQNEQMLNQKISKAISSQLGELMTANLALSTQLQDALEQIATLTEELKKLRPAPTKTDNKDGGLKAVT